MKLQKRFYINKSQLYGLTVYDRTSQTPAFSYGAGQNMREYNAISLTSKLNDHMGRTLHTINKHPEVDEFEASIIIGQVLKEVTNKYRIASDRIEQILLDVHNSRV